MERAAGLAPLAAQSPHGEGALPAVALLPGRGSGPTVSRKAPAGRRLSILRRDWVLSTSV